MGKDICKSLCVLYRLVTCFEHIDTKPHFYQQAKDSKLYFLRANNEVTTYLDEKEGSVPYSKERNKHYFFIFFRSRWKIYIAAKETVLVVKADENLEIRHRNSSKTPYLKPEKLQSST